MLGKLMKHEFRATARLMAPLLGAVLLLSIFVRILGSILDRREAKNLPSAFIGFLPRANDILTVLFVLGLIGLTIFAVVLMVSRFYKNLLTDEGYLMFTLPVSVHGLLWSKLLVSIVWFIATFAVDFLAAVIAFQRNTLDISGLFRALEQINPVVQKHLGMSLPVLLLLMMLAALLAMVLGCLSFYAPVSIGHSFSRHQRFLSVVFYFVFQIAMQVAAIWMLSTNVMQLTIDVYRGQIYAHKSAGAFLLLFGVLLLFCAVLYGITWLMLRRKRNLQ